VVTFDETSPSPSPIFEHAGLDQMGETIFVEEEHDNVDWGDPELTPPAAPVESASTTLDDWEKCNTLKFNLVKMRKILQGF
jgi:hypothetical protein